MAHANKKQISLFVTDKELEDLNRLSKKIGISRQKFLENVLDIGLSEVRSMEKFGLIAIGVGVRDLFDRFKKSGKTLNLTDEKNEVDSGSAQDS